jgi:hypothetical protein
MDERGRRKKIECMEEREKVAKKEKRQQRRENG